MEDYDVIVIGAGSGLDIASAYNSRGSKVALVEPGPLGGTCLNRGCIPSKMLIHRAEILAEVRNSEKFGINAEVNSIDYETIIKEVNGAVGRDAEAIETGIESSENYDLYRTEAKFIDDKVIDVDGKKLAADKIFIAAGTRPFVPPIKGIEDVDYLTSSEALKLEERPESMIIVGGGYIAAEMAFFFNEMGVEITVVERGKRLLSREDKDVSKKFTELAEEQYRVVLGAQAEEIENEGEKRVYLDNGEVLEAEQVLIATGRRPNTDKLRINDTAIALDDRGFIETNKYMETSVEGVYALGDIAGNYMFKHSANLEAQYTYLASIGEKEQVDYRAMPHAVFSKPQIAGVGETEQQLEESGVDYRKAIYNYADTGMGMALKEEEGFVKVMASKSGEILGVHIIGPEASTLIHEVLPVMRQNGSLQDIKDTIHIHPALNEVIGRAFDKL